ncbi:protein LIFEGUARD 4-like [Andrographis paniculata]|uniref:protein LIFEGUARD 4-like n=1 Tax=Andrographis paniculata TaxID=175694 RepID=UPI0021E947D9|nr:protein LIFEGUARD 4-like [Andrographis paniculata]
MASYYAGQNVDLEKGNGEKLYPGMMESPQMRWAFVRKIYSILFVQLLITFGVALAMYLVEPVGRFLRTRDGLAVVIVVTVLMVIFCITMHCVAHIHPWNYIFMFLFTISMAGMVGVVCTQKSGESLLLAAGLTALIFLALTVFTFVAASFGFDFSFLAPFLLCATLLLITFGFIRMLFPMGHIWNQVYGFLGAMLFSAFIIYDTDNVIKRFDYDQYIEAAAALYMDIINLFLSLLELFGGPRT